MCVCVKKEVGARRRTRNVLHNAARHQAPKVQEDGDGHGGGQGVLGHGPHGGGGGGGLVLVQAVSGEGWEWQERKEGRANKQTHMKRKGVHPWQNPRTKEKAGERGTYTRNMGNPTTKYRPYSAEPTVYIRSRFWKL